MAWPFVHMSPQTFEMCTELSPPHLLSPVDQALSCALVVIEAVQVVHVTVLKVPKVHIVLGHGNLEHRQARSGISRQIKKRCVYIIISLQPLCLRHQSCEALHCTACGKIASPTYLPSSVCLCVHPVRAEV